MILKPIQPVGDTKLRLANGEDALLYELPDGMDWAVFQLDLSEGTAWTTNAIVTVRAGLTKAKQYDFLVAVTYTAVGVQLPIQVTGYRFINIYVSTPQAGANVIAPTLNVGKDNA